MGKVAVVAARFEPEYHFDALTTGKDDAAAKGALSAVGGCAQGSGAAALVFIVCLPVAAAVGAISGASDAASEKRVEDAKAAAQREIAALKLQEYAVQGALGYGQKMGLALARLPQAFGPAKPADLPSYMGEKATADSVIEISVLRATALTSGKQDLPVSLGMQARVRVLSTRDGKVIDTLTVRYASNPRPISEWVASNGQAIKAAYDRGSASIAEQAIDEIMLIYLPQAVAKQGATKTDAGGSSLVPPYALRAIEPPIRNKLYVGSKMNYGHLERYLLNGLQPSFTWEAWPRGFDIVPGDEPGQAQRVRYDLRIFGESGIVYQRYGIVDTKHTLEQPLEPCHTYRWTVRAQFILNGAPRVTEWTGAYDTIGGSVAPWWWRRGSGVPPLAHVPPSVIPFYPIVETPSVDGKACPTTAAPYTGAVTSPIMSVMNG